MWFFSWSFLSKFNLFACCFHIENAWHHWGILHHDDRKTQRNKKYKNTQLKSEHWYECSTRWKTHQVETHRVKTGKIIKKREKIKNVLDKTIFEYEKAIQVRRLFNFITCFFHHSHYIELIRCSPCTANDARNDRELRIFSPNKIEIYIVFKSREKMVWEKKTCLIFPKSIFGGIMSTIINLE